MLQFFSPEGNQWADEGDEEIHTCIDSAYKSFKKREKEVSQLQATALISFIWEFEDGEPDVIMPLWSSKRGQLNYLRLLETPTDEQVLK